MMLSLVLGGLAGVAAIAFAGWKGLVCLVAGEVLVVVLLYVDDKI